MDGMKKFTRGYRVSQKIAILSLRFMKCSTSDRLTQGISNLNSKYFNFDNEGLKLSFEVFKIGKMGRPRKKKIISSVLNIIG